MKWHIGCSGFHYKHWKGIFYPEKLPQTKWFKFYCETFNTLELNNTFYSFPKLPALKSWYDNSPDEFTFTVKAPRTITHFRKFVNAKDRINQLYDIINQGLQGKLAAVLFQLPPQFYYTPERLDRIVQSLDSAFSNVIELRHESWWQQPVYEALAQYNITFCGMSHPALPADVVQNTSTLYYRFHGEEQLYQSVYSYQQLLKFAHTTQQTAAKQAFIYFNNDIGGAAIKNSQQLIDILNK